METEPRILAEDVQTVLVRALGRNEDERKESLPALAERAETTSRTVQRIINGQSQTVGLALADRLCIASGTHLSECRVVHADGRIESPWET